MAKDSKVVNMPAAGVTTWDKKLFMPSVKVSDLHVEKNFNARKVLHGIDELAADMKRNGQDTPITIADRLDGKPGYMIVAGHRRYAAAVKAGLETLTANYVGKRELKELIVISVRENADREQLSTYELAKAFEQMADQGMTGRDIEVALEGAGNPNGERGSRRYTIAYINRLVRMVREVHPKIQEEWAAGNRLCTTDFLAKMATDEFGKNHMDLQMKAWRSLVDPANTAEEGPDVDATKAGGATGDAPTPEVVKAAAERERKSKSELNNALSAVKYCLKTAVDKRTPEEYRVMVEVLKWALGYKDTPTLKGAYDAEIQEMMNPAKS